MKQFIRLNTFETNSSSMHSLVVPKQTTTNFDIKNLHGEVTCGEYGWGPEKYSNPYAILSYLWTGLQGSKEEERLKSLFPNITFVPFKEYEDGYIDHQSSDLPFTIIEQDDETVYKIVDNGTLYIYNDNSGYDYYVFDTKNNDVY